MTHHRSMSDAQRAAAITLFESGHSRDAVATRLGVSPGAVRALRERWRIHGKEALVPTRTKRVHAVELKLEVVRRCLAGESKIALAQAYGLSSPQLVATWLRRYRAEGEAGLRPKPPGRPTHDPDAPVSELDQLRQENERLRAEVAYLEKLRALSATERR
jgi:transposase-like protein